jgi:hypothetical protein
VEVFFVDVEDLLHALPRGRIGWTAQDETIIEEHGLDGRVFVGHLLLIVKGRV